MRRAGLALCAVLGLNTAVQANDQPFNLAYRADQLTVRLTGLSADPLLPGRLEDYEPKPVAIAVQTLPREPADDVWQRVREGFAVPDLDGPLVAQWQSWYLARPQLLKALVDRSRRYVYHVVEELDKRNMPTELAFLPMVESGYNPMALSPADASGLWQFIPATGKTYKLEQTPLYDARRDVVASTSAALDYLQALHVQFGDWKLVLASYNWGENAVARAMERNKARGQPTDYRSLVLPEETRNYIPKLQALKNIFANPAAFKIELEPVPNRPYFATVASARDIDVTIAARLAEVSLEEFLALNPAHKQPRISKSAPTGIVVPAERVASFTSNLAEYDQSRLQRPRARN